MKLIKIINNIIIYPYSIEQLKLDNPNTSFPDNITNEVLINFGVYLVLPSLKPKDPLKNIIEGLPTKIDDNFYETWIINDITPDEITIRLNRQWDDIRYQRNQYLSQCDWTQLPDSPLSDIKKQEWTIYRQALRDVTNQLDPFNIVWPVKPQ